MRPLRLMVQLALVALLLAAAGRAQQAARYRAASAYTAVTPRLRTLAARARTRRGWSDLRRYTHSAGSQESRGLAYFALGYREYLAQEDGLAAEDFKAAANCSLADIATYYGALASRQINRPDDAITALTGFRERYPQSIYRLRVADLLASLLIKAGRPEQALDELQAEPLTKRRSSSLLLTAQAEGALKNDMAAAQTYQVIYVAFPTVPEARQAETALNQLRQRLGPHFPEMNDEAQTVRAKNLLQRGRYPQALASYDNSLLTLPHSWRAASWRIGRARCFIAMRQYALALTALSQKEKDPDLDAERLSLRVRVDELNNDEPSMLKDLDEAYHQHPHSSYYADALAYAGGYFARQGFWPNAAKYYALLAQNFPDSGYASEAAWRVAWYSVLAGNLEAAETGLAGFLKHFPGSSLAPAALYWLAQVEGGQGHSEDAGEIYRLLAARYEETYYGLRARQKLPRRARTRTTDARSDEPSASHALQQLGVTIAARPAAPLAPCGADAPDDLLTPSHTLAELSLTDLAEQVLEDTMASHPDDPLIAVALARSRAARKDAAGALFAAKEAAPRYGEYPFSALPEDVWKFLYPRTDWSLVRRYARADRLDPYLVMGLIRQESAFNPRATSSTNARGLMQMEPYTAVDRVRGRLRRRRVVRSLYSPAYNIRAGCLYLRGLLRQFDNNLPETLAAYNAGDIRVRQWMVNSKVEDPDKFLETIPFTDTRAYVEMVLRDRMIYHSILTGEARFVSCPFGARRGGIESLSR
ncbi:MAG: transglycosylase SLT domain-containing protein [Terriglobia bacterium]